MSEVNMNEHLRGKYTTSRTITGFPAKARTGNSHGPAKSKMPAKVPCKRAPAGPGGFKADLRPTRLMEMHVDALSGHTSMHDAGTMETNLAKFAAMAEADRLDK